jgi:hypothetical protein
MAYTEYSIHRVQHPPKIVCLHFIFTIMSWPLNIAVASDVLPYRSTATRQFSVKASKEKSPHHIPMVLCKLSDEYNISTRRASHRPPPDQSPPSTPPISLDHRLPPVHLQTLSITALPCISNITRSWHLSASPNSHDYGLVVFLRIHSILVPNCIAKLAQSRPSSASLCSLDLSLQV